MELTSHWKQESPSQSDKYLMMLLIHETLPEKAEKIDTCNCMQTPRRCGDSPAPNVRKIDAVDINSTRPTNRNNKKMRSLLHETLGPVIAIILDIFTAHRIQRFLGWISFCMLFRLAALTCPGPDI